MSFEKDPLTYTVENGRLTISIGVETLTWAAMYEPRDTATSGMVIADADQFAKDVIQELSAEREDGSTLITDAIDRACGRAFGSGSLGVDYKATAKQRCTCGHLWSYHVPAHDDELAYCHFCDCERAA